MARILQVCNTDFYLTRFLVPLILRLQERGHEVECLCEGQEWPSQLVEAGIKIHNFPFPRKTSPVAFQKHIRALVPILRSGNYDLVNCHNRNSSIVTRVAAWRAKVPVNLYTAHGLYCNDAQSRSAYRFAEYLEQALAPITTYTLTQSREDRDHLVDRLGVDPARVSYVGNGVDLDRFRPGQDRLEAEQRLQLSPDKLRIVAVGRLVEGKGFHHLLEAFARIRADRPDAELVQVGGNIAQDVSPFEAQYRSRLLELGLEGHVIMTGMTNDVPSYLAASDIFALPSYWEGLPRSLIEAMAMELPVVATTIRGCRELVDHGVHGYLVPPRDPQAIERALRRFLSLGPAERRAMGVEGRAKAVPFFGSRAYVDRQVAVMDALVGHRVSSSAGQPLDRVV